MAGARCRAATHPDGVARATAKSQVSRFMLVRALPARPRGLQRRQHALAHFLRRAAREGERQDALRGVDRGQQPQIALRQQASSCRSRPAPAPAPNRPRRIGARARQRLHRRCGRFSHRSSASSSSAAGTRHSPANGTLLQARSVGATAARPAAKSAASLSMRRDHDLDQVPRCRLPFHRASIAAPAA